MRKLRLLLIAAMLCAMAPAIDAVDPLDTKLLTAAGDQRVAHRVHLQPETSSSPIAAAPTCGG